MVQFLIGFWCGCIAAVLVGCIAFSNKIRQWKEISGKNATGEQNKEASEASEREQRNGPCVLIVDDSKLSRTVMKELLLKYEPDIYEAESGAESLKLVKEHRFDLIFMDQHMPGLNGDETLQYLRERGDVSREVPVIAVGSTVRKEHEEEYREKGYAACLAKPLQENRLSEILSRLLPKDAIEEKPDGFSYRKGLTNFDGNEQVYRETLVLFADLWEERKEQLRQFLEEKNMPEYAILIHAIKGDARTLGAEGLGELAYAQELQAKAGDEESVEQGFARVIKEGDMTAEYFKRMFS